MADIHSAMAEIRRGKENKNKKKERKKETGPLAVQRRKVRLTPTTRCRAVTLPRHETRWNLQGRIKLPDRSQPLVGRSSTYYEDMWRAYCCLTIFFRLSICALIAKI